MKIAIIGLAASALLLAGCSGGTDGDNSPAPSASPSSTAIAEGPTSSAEPTVGNLADPLCAAAQQNVEDASTFEDKANELTSMLSDSSFLTSEDTADLNAWGEDMLVLTGENQNFYVVALKETDGEDINAGFVVVNNLLQKYTLVLAQTAADATSNSDFFTDIQALSTEADVTDAISKAPESAQKIATYLGDRCDITG